MPDTTTIPVNVILASNSPRRKQLLEEAGVKFTVYTGSTEVDESLDADQRAQPSEAVKKLAERKAGSVIQDILAENPVGLGIVIGADTTVVLDGEMLGKPYSADHAREMLGRLSGRTHEVITGVSVWLVMLNESEEKGGDGNVSLAFRSFSETSTVTFKELSTEDINAYVATGETIDKAGAYAIQGKGRRLVESYDGDFNNIVGWPVATLLHTFPEIRPETRDAVLTQKEYPRLRHCLSAAPSQNGVAALLYSEDLLQNSHRHLSANALRKAFVTLKYCLYPYLLHLEVGKEAFVEQHPNLERILFSEDEIRTRVKEMGAQITEDYAGKSIVVISVLRGAGIIKDLSSQIEGRHVLIDEDILDSGLTLRYLIKNLESRNPASIEVATLLRKDTPNQADIKCKYIGFECPDEFIVGYGLDYAERYRNLSCIGVLKPEAAQE